MFDWNGTRNCVARHSQYNKKKTNNNNKNNTKGEPYFILLMHSARSDRATTLSKQFVSRAQLLIASTMISAWDQKRRSLAAAKRSCIVVVWWWSGWIAMSWAISFRMFFVLVTRCKHHTNEHTHTTENTINWQRKLAINVRINVSRVSLCVCLWLKQLCALTPFYSCAGNKTAQCNL